MGEEEEEEEEEEVFLVEGEEWEEEEERRRGYYRRWRARSETSPTESALCRAPPMPKQSCWRTTRRGWKGSSEPQI